MNSDLKNLINGDASLFVGNTATHSLGWLNHPETFGRQWCQRVLSTLPDRRNRLVLLAMGGSSSPARLWRDAKSSTDIHIIDTSHPDDFAEMDFTDATVIAASKSGNTVETRSGLEVALSRGLKPVDLVVITDPGSALESLANHLGAHLVLGDLECGGRFSALSPFGLVPAYLSGWSVDEISAVVEENRPTEGLVKAANEFVQNLFASFHDGVGYFPVESSPVTTGGGLWIDQLIAESTGKDSRGAIPIPRYTTTSYMPQTIMFWHLVTALLSRALGVDPFNQPNVELAKRNVGQMLTKPVSWETPQFQQANFEASASVARYITFQVFAPLESESYVDTLQAQAAKKFERVTANLGPRYLHSTGQLHKGGPGPLTCVQILQRPKHLVTIPNQNYSMNDLCAAQAHGDALALADAGRLVFQMTVDDIEESAALLGFDS